MKKLLLFVFVIPLLSSAQDCDKYFMKEKVSKKSIAFKESNLTQTKMFPLMTDGHRIIYTRFVSEGKEQRMEIITDYREGLKREIRIGTEQKMALVFADSSINIIEFVSNSQLIQEMKGTAITSAERKYSNSIPLTPELFAALKTKKLVMIEIQNPFGMDFNVRTKTFEVSKSEAERINKISICFESRIQ
jgi:hypothetical protein